MKILILETLALFPPKSDRAWCVTGTRLQSWDVLASRHHIAIQLEDRLPAPLRDVNNTDKDDLIHCYPPHTDPPVRILSFNSLGILEPVEMQTVKMTIVTAEISKMEGGLQPGTWSPHSPCASQNSRG